MVCRANTSATRPGLGLCTDRARYPRDLQAMAKGLKMQMLRELHGELNP